MISQITLSIASCVAVLGCTNNLQPTSEPDLITTQERNVIQQSSKDKAGSNPEEYIILANNDRSIIANNYMILVKTSRKNSFGNPLYELKLFADGREINSFDTVSGRYHTQNKNRNVSGTQAPLPNGEYTVSQYYVPGTHYEVGGRFLPIHPKFGTGRSALGIHYDPSFEKSQKDDGTAGCIALTNKEELDVVLNYVQQYQPKFLDVQI